MYFKPEKIWLKGAIYRDVLDWQGHGDDHDHHPFNQLYKAAYFIAIICQASLELWPYQVQITNFVTQLYIEAILGYWSFSCFVIIKL